MHVRNYGASFVVLGSILFAAYMWMKSRAERIPTKWKRVGRLKEIYFYPLKSGGSIKLESATCDTLGFVLGNFKDRMFMLIDRENKMISARIYPKMLKIQPVINGEDLVLSAPGKEDLRVTFPECNEENMMSANLWDENIMVALCGSEYDQWFSDLLLGKAEGIRLVYYCHDKPVKQPRNGEIQHEDTGCLHDKSSYMLMTTASLRDLNSKLTEKVTENNFRPNFFVSCDDDEKPFEEETWKWVRIGSNVVFRNLSPCYRCILTNINPVTATRSVDHEPLRTLKKYRSANKYNSPTMGIHLAVREKGVVCANDDVFVGA